MRIHIITAITFLCLLLPGPAVALENRVVCGEYSFVLPEGFELREFTYEGNSFDKALIINNPAGSKDLSSAIVFCVREKKTEFRSFALPAKERINLQTAPRRYIQMLITATEDVRHDGMWIKFSLLEEKSTNAREIKDRERFAVAIEMDAVNEGYHTIFFICDFRKGSAFLDSDEYKSQVTGVAIDILDSIKRVI